MAAEFIPAPPDTEWQPGLTDAKGRPLYCVEILDAGRGEFRVPVTNLFDVDGDEIADRAQGCIFVAPYRGQWISAACEPDDIHTIQYD